MDFRMDKSSWGMIAFMIATMAYFMVQGAGSGIKTSAYFQMLGFSLLTVIVLIALASIPVLIYCYFVKKIPDIDYSVRTAFAFTIIGIISEIIS